MTFGLCPFLIGFRPTFYVGLTMLTTAFGGVQFEPLNGASLFSTVVKPRAYYNGICVSSHARLARRMQSAQNTNISS